MRVGRRTISQIVLLLGCLIAGILAISDVQSTELPQNVPAGMHTVVDTIDGDTIDVLVGGEEKRVRMIGVDTPETKDPRKGVQCFGKEAAGFTKQSLLHQFVRLEADPTQDATDMYGRLLRYVFLEDGTNFNQKLIAQGYAYEYTYGVPYQHQSEFKAAERTARAQKYGLWADDACSH